MTQSLIVEGLAWIVAGVLWGAAHLWLIRQSVRRLADAGSWGPLAALSLLRLAAAAVILFIAARAGALPLLSMLAGFLIARSLAIYRAKAV